VVRSEHVFAFQVNSKVYGALLHDDDAQQRLVIDTLVARLRQSASPAGGDQFLNAQF
jgi:hypothetical protein